MARVKDLLIEIQESLGCDEHCSIYRNGGFCEKITAKFNQATEDHHAEEDRKTDR